ALKPAHPSHHCQNQERQNRWKRVSLAFGPPGIRNLLEQIDETWCGVHAVISLECMTTLPFVTTANLTRQGEPNGPAATGVLVPAGLPNWYPLWLQSTAGVRLLPIRKPATLAAGPRTGR